MRKMTFVLLLLALVAVVACGPATTAAPTTAPGASAATPTRAAAAATPTTALAQVVTPGAAAATATPLPTRAPRHAL